MQQPMHTVSSGNPISYAFTFALTEGETKELRCQTSEKQNPGWGMLSGRLFPLSLRGFLTHIHPANGCRQWVLRPRVQSWMCWAAHQGPHRSFGMKYTVFGECWLWRWACWALGPRKGRGGQRMLSKNYASIAFIVCLHPLSSSSIKPRSDTVFLMCRGNWGSGKWADFIQGYALRWGVLVRIFFLLLWCPRRKSNFSLQIEGDFYRDHTRKRKLLEPEKFLPLSLPSDLYCDLSYDSLMQRPCSTSCSGTLHNWPSNLITVAIEVISLMNSTRKGGNIIQKPQKSLLVACILSAAPWLLYPHGMLENWEAAEGWQMLGRPTVCHCYLFEWTTLMLKCDAEFSLIFFLHKLKMHIARPQFPQMTVLICRPSWRQLGWNELVRTELTRWDYCHHRKRKRAELFLI